MGRAEHGKHGNNYARPNLACHLQMCFQEQLVKLFIPTLIIIIHKKISGRQANLLTKTNRQKRRVYGPHGVA